MLCVVHGETNNHEKKKEKEGGKPAVCSPGREKVPCVAPQRYTGGRPRETLRYNYREASPCGVASPPARNQTVRARAEIVRLPVYVYVYTCICIYVYMYKLIEIKHFARAIAYVSIYMYTCINVYTYILIHPTS